MNINVLQICCGVVITNKFTSSFFPPDFDDVNATFVSIYAVFFVDKVAKIQVEQSIADL